MNLPLETDLVKLSQGGLMAEALPMIEGEVERMEAALVRRVYTALEAGTLTPEAALLAWQEKYLSQKLIKRLTQKVRVGKVASERLQPHMDGGD
jgi:hypothetical protein